MTTTSTGDNYDCLVLVVASSQARAAGVARSLPCALQDLQRTVSDPLTFGFEVVTDVSGARVTSSAPAVALVDGPSQWRVRELLGLGVLGVLGLDEPVGRVLDVTHAVLGGSVVVPRGARAALDRPTLTARQKQILGLLVLGLSNREIAERLFLAEVTVKTHLTKIFAKLEVQSRSEAIALILDPTSGLGPGILAIGKRERAQVGYGGPRVS